jgi:hypothetical protein
MNTHIRSESGFSIVESIFAIGIVTFGLMSLAGVMVKGMQHLSTSQLDLIANEKAAEAVESVFTARDTRVLTWAQIRNVVGESGADGLINTADDGAVEQIVKPGADGLLGTADDEATELSGFTREIEIRDLEDNLRQIRVLVRYPAGGGIREIVLLTYISSFA